MGPRIKVLLL